MSIIKTVTKHILKNGDITFYFRNRENDNGYFNKTKSKTDEHLDLDRPSPGDNRIRFNLGEGNGWTLSKHPIY